MPDTLAAKIRAKHPGAYDDMDDAELESAVRKKFPGAYDDIPLSSGSRKPASAEDFMTPEDIANRDMTVADLGIGALKAAGRSVVGLSKFAAMPGALVGGQGAEHPIFKRADAALASSNPAQDVGGYMETAAELAVPVTRAVKAAPAIARSIVSAAKSPAGQRALDIAEYVPVIGDAIHKGRTRKLLGSILDAAKKPAEAVPAAVRPPAPVFTGTSPIPAVVPQGGFSMPAPRPAPTVTPPVGRVVPRTEPSINTALADQLEAIRTARAMPPVELPPPATLPAGYTPRASAPKPRLVKPAPEPAPAEPRKRAYFLKPESELAVVADDVPVTPSGTLDPDALPAAWQQHIGQDLFPLTGKEGEAVAAELLQELTSRGLSVGEAMMAVSKNPEVPVQLRQQLLKSLSRVKVKR